MLYPCFLYEYVVLLVVNNTIHRAACFGVCAFHSDAFGFSSCLNDGNGSGFDGEIAIHFDTHALVWVILVLFQGAWFAFGINLDFCSGIVLADVHIAIGLYAA